MKLRFLGTRGEIEARSQRHRRHSVLHVSHGGRALLVDCGRDWLGQLPRVEAEALLLTHAHPDHAGGLRGGCPWPVYATEEAWAALRRYPLDPRLLVTPGEGVRAAGMRVDAVPVEHSLRAPAVAYRIAAGRTTIIYAPDVAALPARGEALSGIDLYVGDGAAVIRSILRRRDGHPIGHASIKAQLDWCADCGVPQAVFTHCGSEILRDEADAATRVERLARERAMRAEIAYDGLELVVRASR